MTPAGRFSRSLELAKASWLGMLAFYILAYFIGPYFNTALVGAAMIRLDGGNPTVGDGLRIAWAQGVYSAALYRCATHGGKQVPGFGPDLLQAAFKPKG